MYHPDIFIRDKDALAAKLEQFTVGNTRVVTDFDDTMTQRGSATSWGLFHQIEKLGSTYHDERTRLYDIFHAHEVDPRITKDDRDAFMRFWWKKHLQLFGKYGLHEQHFNEIDMSHAVIRTGIREGIEFFRERDIPVLVLSAGISQMVEMVLEHHNLRGGNMSITANKLLFDEEGAYIGVYPRGCIHIGNKDEHHTPQSIQQEFGNRSNIILLGDSLDDIRMIRKEERDSTVAVGYYTSNRKGREQEYQETFDIVVSSDVSDLGVLEHIVQNISQ